MDEFLVVPFEDKDPPTGRWDELCTEMLNEHAALGWRPVETYPTPGKINFVFSREKQP